MKFGLSRRVVTEAIGTAGLLIAVVGSGVMGDRLSQHNDFLTLLANSLATGAALVALVGTLSPISGAHFNPAVSLAAALQRDLPWSDFVLYVAAQLAGAFVGVATAHLMFGLPVFSIATKVRNGPALAFSEFIATTGLLLVIACGARFRPWIVSFTVAAYITGAYWFTSSTSFANPAVTLARTLTDTFVGIRPSDAVPFITCELMAALVTAGFVRWLSEGNVVEEKSNE